MTLNFPGPYELRFFYDVTTSPGGELRHVMRLNVDPVDAPAVGDPFDEIYAKNIGGTSFRLDLACLAIEGLLAPLFYGAGTAFVNWELWKYDPLSFDASYVATHAAVDTATGVIGVSKGGQVILVWRTAEGGIVKNSLMETQYLPGERAAYSELTADWADWVDTWTDDAVGIYLGRDTSYPAAFKAAYPGTNEHLFKRRYRG